MPSPFSGMNPYLEKEAYWQDFHQTFIPTIRAMLTAQVAPHYFVRVEQYVFLHELPAVDREIHGYLTIRDRWGHNAVTVVELLSPSNKNVGAVREDYLRERRAFFLSGTHIVEIDLLRGGSRPLLKDVLQSDYLLTVSRTDERSPVELWPIQLCQRLPQIPIPLHAPDPDAVLDVQEALDRVYDSAGYAPLLYETPPQPPLSAEQAKWARQFIPVP